LTKLGCGQGCCTSTPTCVANVFGIIGCREIMSSFLINHFNLSFTKGQLLNSCPICWRYANDDGISTVECMFGIGIFHWTNGVFNYSHNKYIWPTILIKWLYLLDNVLFTSRSTINQPIFKIKHEVFKLNFLTIWTNISSFTCILGRTICLEGFLITLCISNKS